MGPLQSLSDHHQSFDDDHLVIETLISVTKKITKFDFKPISTKHQQNEMVLFEAAFSDSRNPLTRFGIT